MTSVDRMEPDNRWVLVGVAVILATFAGWTWVIVAGW